MSHGIFDHKRSGCCETNQANGQRVAPGNYRLQVFAHENKLASDYCQKNSDAAITNTFDSVGYRVEVENDLTDRDQLTYCDALKHQPCVKDSTDMRCNPGIPANPYICERDITPTNMKLPANRGF